MPGILAIFETRNNEPLPFCAELTAATDLLAASVEGEADALCPIESRSTHDYSFAAGVFDRLLFAEHEQFLYGNPQLTAEVACSVFDSWGYEYILLPHSIDGAATAAAIAAKCNAECISGITGIEFEGDAVSFGTSIQGGHFNIELTPSAKPVVLTIAAGSFKPAKHSGATVPPAETADVQTPPEQRRVTTLGLGENERADRTLEQAEVIVSAGRGIGKAENLKLIEQLADLFVKSAVAGSRPVCDYGWLPYSRQVGITGRSVTPKLYLACGISGSSQHLAGIREAEYVVAVNRDPNAAIFSVADIAIVADLFDFIPAFIERSKEKN